MKAHFNHLVIAFAVIITSLIFSNAIKTRNQTDHTISVTGLGKKDFVSDLIVWSGSFTEKKIVLKEAYSALDNEREIIKKYLISKGIKAENLVFSSIDINKDFDESYDNFGNKTDEIFTGYRLQQTIEIESNEVDKVENISRQVSELINFGVEFYSNNPEYYYTKLSELKIQMIAEATKDAQTRAKKIAENAGCELAKLKKGNMGVFQILAQNSSEDFSWGGSFNTSSKRKTAMITMKLDYEIN